MKLGALLALLAIAFAPAAHAEDRLQYDWPEDAAVTLGLGLLLGGELLLREELAPDDCRWCGRNALDRSFTEWVAWENHEAASTASDIGLGTVAFGGLAWGFAADGWEDGAVDGLVLFETLAANMLITEVLKLSVARQRPLAFYVGASHEKRLKSPHELNGSFPSSHASLSFAAVAATATIAELRGRDSLAIWLVGIPAASAVSYFRVAGYHHWLTDVLAGAALGTGVGLLLPRLLHEGERSRGPDEGALRAPFTYGFVF